MEVTFSMTTKWYVCTCSWVHSPHNQVVILVNPLAIALEVDLRRRSGSAGEHHWLVFHDELILWFHQEVR